MITMDILILDVLAVEYIPTWDATYKMLFPEDTTTTEIQAVRQYIYDELAPDCVSIGPNRSLIIEHTIYEERHKEIMERKLKWIYEEAIKDLIAIKAEDDNGN